MSSSTSSSDARRPWFGGEWRVVLAMLAFLLVAEGAMRYFEKHLSKDIEHIRDIPGLMREMKAHDGRRVLFIGNSLTRCSVDPAMIERRLVEKGVPNPGVFFFYPDATSVGNWYYGFRRYVLNTGCKPDVVFIGTGPRHLADRIDGDATRLGAFFVSNDQVTEALRHEFSSYEQKCEFLIARFSILHASRSRVKPRVFGPLIPDYFEMEQWVNNQRNAGMREAAVDTDTFRHLDLLLGLLKREGIEAHVFTIPQPVHYDVLPEARRIIEKHGAHLHDLANLPAISPASFRDGYHLNTEGGQIYCRALAADL